MVVTIRLKPGAEEEYASNLKGVLDRMRYEPSFINTVVHRDPDDSTNLMLYETWADRDEFFTVQMTRDYRRRYEERLPHLIRSPRQMVIWQPLRGDFRFAHDRDA